MAIIQSPLGESHKRHSVNLICPRIVLHFTAIIRHFKPLEGMISFRDEEGTCRGKEEGGFWGWGRPPLFRVYEERGQLSSVFFGEGFIPVFLEAPC